MFIFDQFKRNDQQLRVVAFGLLAGMVILLVGLWEVQILSSRASQKKMEKNSLRYISIPGVRGKILDRNGNVLADNLPRYDVVLFLEEMRAEFNHERTNTVVQDYRRANPTNKLTEVVKNALSQEAAYRVVSNITGKVTTFLGQSVALNRHAFIRRYNDLTYVPFPIMANLNPKQVALFSEQLSDHPSMELEVQPIRNYPNATTAAHLLGYVQREKGDNGPDDFLGKNGLESKFDDELHGTAGTNWVVINSSGYRQSEQVEVPAEPGNDLYLTIDLALQQATEKALSKCDVTDGSIVRGAAIVIDVNTGDILALASAPSYDPNGFITGRSAADQALWADPKYKPEFNRAILGSYNPGSTFKIITALACMESGVMDPTEKYYSEGFFRSANHTIHDEAPAGYYDFHRAFYKSSNTYFIYYGLKAGLAKITEVGRRFHFGEKTDKDSTRENVGRFPRPEEVGHKWNKSSTADVCIGQEIEASPLQLACFTATIASGGKMYWPRMVSHLKSPATGEEKMINAAGRLRDQVKMNPQHLELIHQAMLADTENPDASAYAAFHNAKLGTTKFHVAGKTGTAERISTEGLKTKVTTFISYAPYEAPRYAVVVMAEHGKFGGTSCAPAACAIYQALEKMESTPPAARTMAQN